MAINYQERVLSLMLLSSSILENIELNQEEREILSSTWVEMLKNKPTKNYKESVNGFLEIYKILNGSMQFDINLAKEYVQDIYQRSKDVYIQWFEDFTNGISSTHNHVKAQQGIIYDGEKIKNINIPVLVIHGSKDILAFPRLIKESIVDKVHNVKFIKVEGMGHMIFNKDVLEYIKNEIVSFIARKS